MNPNFIEHLVEKFHNENFRGDDAHGLAHSRRILAIAKYLDKEKSCDEDVLIICSYFHDIVSFKKGRLETAKRSKTLSFALLKSFFEENQNLVHTQDRVLDCIDSHSFSGRKIPMYQEGRIIQDADKIDALGYVGVARLFMVAGKMGTSLMDLDDPFAKNRTPNDKYFALDHFICKLRKLPEEMNTKTGEDLARDRLSSMEEFIDKLVHEAFIEYDFISSNM